MECISVNYYYKENFFEFTAPGGTIVNESGNKTSSTICIFKSENGIEGVKATVQLFSRLIRQYKYLEKSLDEEMKKVAGFTQFL